MPNRTPERTARPRRYLMCRPTFFTVDYTINPWMDPARPTDTDLAVRQWERLCTTYRRLGHTVELIEPLPGLPDMVYTANGATVLDGRALVATFRHPERAGESDAHQAWFRSAGYREVHRAGHVNEGRATTWWPAAGCWPARGSAPTRRRTPKPGPCSASRCSV